MKAVILCGGNGTRLLPLTEAINKHLLPLGPRTTETSIVGEPMVFHPIRKCAEAGIKEVLIVTGGNCPDGFLSLIIDGKDLGVDSVYYAYQCGAGGIAAALKLAENFVGNDHFVVMLGDNIFTGDLTSHIDAYKAAPDYNARVHLYEVKDPHRFGCPRFNGKKLVEIIEKPSNPPSSYAVTGLYFYPPSVFSEVLPILKESKRGELEITDVNNYYLQLDRLDYGFLDGKWSDAGTWKSWEEANAIVRGQ